VRILVAHAPQLLVRELVGRGHELLVAHYPGEWAASPPGATACRFVAFPPRAKADPRSIWQMRRLIVAWRPDIVHAFSPRSLAAAVLATVCLPRPPAIMSFRGISSPPHWHDLADRFSFLSPRVGSHACESEAVADGLVQAGIPRHSCHVVYNCVEPGAVGGRDRPEARAALGLPADAFVVGSIASIRPVKGIDILLRAARECLDLPDLRVVIVGPVKDAAVERLARDPGWRGRLLLPGFVPRAGGLAGAFDVFAMPSRAEGLCRALLEAMSQGICPVVSDAGGMKEVVRAGRDGLVVPRGDVPALAAAIRHLHGRRGLIHDLGAEARHRVAALCSPAAMAERVERAYRRVLGHPADRLPAEQARAA
jgi:glycosyltransferase involved in cell wall biosynthesis